MKSFKRKALEKRERLKQERLLREEQARQDRLNKEWQEARDKEKRDAKEWHAIVANKEDQRLLEIKKLNQPKKVP